MDDRAQWLQSSLTPQLATFVLPETQALIDEAEIRSGNPVHVVVDPDLVVSATIRIARHGVQQHFLQVKPSGASDYFIANQIIFMLRMVELPTDQRFDFSPTSAAAVEMSKIARTAPMAAGVAGPDGTSVTDSLAKWALMQVRSIPIGMRADQKIFRDMPALRASTETGIGEQNRDNLSAIQRVQGLVPLPEQHFWPAAAYALFSDRLLGRSLYSVPFDAMGLNEGGRQLLRL